jgi:Senescence regulator
MEEFEEEDILWPDLEVDNNEEGDIEICETHSVVCQRSASAPIRIPLRDNVSCSWTAGINYNPTGSNTQDDGDDDDDGDGDGDDYNGVGQGTTGKDIPATHIFVQQKNDGKNKMARSVCEGYGRTLKGRDLRNTRDMIHRLTGFLEKS